MAALRASDTAFWSPYTAQIHARSVAQCAERQMARNAPLSRPVGLRCRHLRDLFGPFLKRLSEKSQAWANCLTMRRVIAAQMNGSAVAHSLS